MFAPLRRRIVVLSENLASPWDEGIKKFTWSVGSALSRDHDVRVINVDRSGVGPTEGVLQAPGSATLTRPGVRRLIRPFDPELVIYVPSPSDTLLSFLRCAVLRRHAPHATIGMVALIPRRHAAFKKPVIANAAPDVVFVPSYQSLLHLSDLRVESAIVPIGVDLSTFRRPQSGEKAELRRRYGVGENAYVYLHVGHLSRKRNIESLIPLVEAPGSELVVVGSTSTPQDNALRAELESLGVHVIRETIPIEEVYRLADCYVFPVIDGEGAIEFPLSVLEAMASGLPVLSRPFGGLRDHLEEGPDLRYWDSNDELLAHAARLRNNGLVEVRGVDAFSWSEVARRLVRALEERSPV